MNNKIIKDQCIIRLNKLKPIYLCFTEDLGKYGKRLWVMYKEKGSVKYGFIQGAYRKRSGISVVARLKSLSPTDLWQLHNNAIDDEEFMYMMRLMGSGRLDEFPELDLEELRYEE